MKPRSSIVIANYNMGQFVTGAIDSVLQQTDTNLEVIVVDDGSSDNSWELIEAAARKDSRVKAIKQNNSGQASAKNAGIRASSGQFVGFCDADDEWKPDKLQVQLPLFDHKEVGVVYSDLDTIDENGTFKHTESLERPNGWVLDKMFVTNIVPFGTAIVRREALDKCGHFNESFKMGIDWDLWLRIARLYQFHHAPVSTIRYRVWSGQMSNNWKGRYYWAERIMGDFVKNFPGAISKTTFNDAWCDTYLQRAVHRAILGKERVAATIDVCRALRHKPLYPAAWKTFPKIWLTTW